MSHACAVCGITKEVNPKASIHEWGWADEGKEKVHVCESCESDYSQKLENAIWEATPEHFQEPLYNAIVDFCVSDRETDMLDVLWNLSDTIKYPDTYEMGYLFTQFLSDEEKEALVYPTPEEFAKIVQAFIDNLHPKSPRLDYMKNDPDGSTDAMTWNFVKDLFFKEAVQ